jgi:hypothetical protein
VRELHVVAVSEDGRHVLLAGQRGATKGGFRVALDDRLSAALRGDLPRPGEAEPHPSELTPKDIQARLRAGESAASIAASAGVPVARVERFSGPVQGEMARVIDAARSSYLVRGRLGRSAVALGAAVDAAIALSPSLREDGTDWSTRREEDGTWLVTVTWFARKRSREASWRYDPTTKAVSAADPASAALAHVDPEAAGRAPRRRPAADQPVPAKKPAAKKPAAKKAAATKAPAKKAAATKAPVTKSAARPVTKPVTKAAVKKAAAAPAKAVKPAPARKAPARAVRVVPDPEPKPARTAADRDGVKTRVSVPGWADVLLGTSPGGDR